MRGLETSSLQQLSKEIDVKYCSAFVKDPRSVLDLKDDTESWYEDITSRLKCERSDLQAETFSSNKVTKSVLGGWLETAVDLFDRNDSVIQHLLRVLYLSKMDLITSQQKIITLQEELLTVKNDQISSIKSAVQNTVHEELLTSKHELTEQTESIQFAVKNTVKSEMRSYSATVSATSSLELNEKSLKTAVRDAIEEEDKN